jgi:intracellular sulfur oxidation DsrE/DsrF family protein
MNDTVILVTRAGVGDAPGDLQLTLAANYFKLLIDNGLKPTAICFYGDGVKLVVEGSSVIGLLQTLQARGVHLIVCMTCLKYFELMDKLQVGIVGGMGDILAAQIQAAKVVSL